MKLRVARWLQKYTYKLYELADELVYRCERRDPMTGRRL